MDGLIIKRQWLDLILSGKKTLEIRSSDTKKVGEAIYLLESGTHRVRGKCRICSTHPISCSNWSEEYKKHCVDITYAELKKIYKSPYAWELTEVEPIKTAWYYNHPKGAVIWVKDVNPFYSHQKSTPPS